MGDWAGRVAGTWIPGFYLALPAIRTTNLYYLLGTASSTRPDSGPQKEPKVPRRILATVEWCWATRWATCAKSQVLPVDGIAKLDA